MLLMPGAGSTGGVAGRLPDRGRTDAPARGVLLLQREGPPERGQDPARGPQGAGGQDEGPRRAPRPTGARRAGRMLARRGRGLADPGALRRGELPALAPVAHKPAIAGLGAVVAQPQRVPDLVCDRLVIAVPDRDLRAFHRLRE